MPKQEHHLPPSLARRFLRWFCKPSLLEDIEGDLMEDFNDHIESKGLKKARLLYLWGVIRFFRPFAIKQMSSSKFTTTMFSNYFKTSLRSIARNKLFSFINVFGLAVSMSVCLLMISILTEIKSYDKFHDRAGDIYRITNSYQYLDMEEPSMYASTSIIAGKRLKEEVPGVEAVTLMRRNFSGDFDYNNEKYVLSGFWADQDFFNVFSFEVLYGNPSTALSEPQSLVITDETALKIFNELNVVGKTVMKRDVPYQVTAVVKKPPFNSHLKFSIIGSMITFEEPRMQDNPNGWLSWQNMWMNFAYFKVKEDYSIENIQAGLDVISDDQNSREEHLTIQLQSQSILDIMTGPSMYNEPGVTMGSKTLWILGLLSFVVILSAGFNYTNLSIARSLRRAKEVGVRKVVGARKSQIFSQFTTEACIISIFSLVLSYFIFLIIKPLFLNLNGQMSGMLKLELTLDNALFFIAFALIVGLTAGFMPSWVLSRLRAIQVLKTNAETRLFSNVSVRKILIVIQFTLTLIFIISAHIAFNQFRYAMNFDKGFNGDKILNVRLAGNEPDLVKSLFESIPEVKQTALSAMILGTGERWGDNLKYKDPLDSTTLYYSSIDQNYLPMLKHEIIAGSNFQVSPFSGKESEIIVNEQTLKRFNIGSPQEAIGEQLKVGPDMLTIVGVVKDFHYDRIDQPIECFGFRQRLIDIQHINLKLETSDLLGTMDKLRAAWDDFDKVHPFNARFYSDYIEQAYSEYEVMFTIVSFLAIVSISIAVLGLLGMGVYTAETRLKEISIRKVLGASESSLVQLLVKGFMLLLLIAAIIAIPSTYYIFDQIVLADQVNRISIGLNELGLGVLFIFAIGLLTIGSQIWKAARSNPASTLRNE
ncbi:ABC transporter permease [Roseivirga sp.]|uniref:ABC transporter permease n=1 Tax=Roseivirga sp. TaxID=1964215 RepID=UPI003B52B615